jgi:hypothetical protein
MGMIAAFLQSKFHFTFHEHYRRFFSMLSHQRDGQADALVQRSMLSSHQVFEVLLATLP